MKYVDGLKPDMRALVYEFGLLIVSDMISDGYRSALALRPILETWRKRRQEEWLATDFIRPSMSRHIDRMLADGPGYQAR